MWMVRGGMTWVAQAADKWKQEVQGLTVRVDEGVQQRAQAAVGGGRCALRGGRREVRGHRVGRAACTRRIGVKTSASYCQSRLEEDRNAYTAEVTMQASGHALSTTSAHSVGSQ